MSEMVSKLNKLEMLESTCVYHFVEGLRQELQMEVLKEVLKANTDRVAAFTEPTRDIQSVLQLVQELKQELKQEMGRIRAEMNGRGQRGRGFNGTQQRSQNGRPLCFYCNSVGHIQNACPYRQE